MPRMKILNGAERMLFDRPPQLSSAERGRVFEPPVAVWSAANDIQSVSGKIGFLDAVMGLRQPVAGGAAVPQNDGV